MESRATAETTDYEEDPNYQSQHSLENITNQCSPPQSRDQSANLSRHSNISSANALYIAPFGFDSKTSFDASKGLARIRSDNYNPKPPPLDDDIWKRPPPDFRPQNFAPNPPARNSRDAMQPWKYGTIPGKREIFERPPRVVRSQMLKEREPQEANLVTRFKILDPWGAKLVMCREGLNKPGQYEMPKPHDFRGYPPIQSLGLPEFETNHEHDPYNIRFKSRRLDIIPGEGPGLTTATDRDTKGRQMAPPLPIAPRWEARLIMPKKPWPSISQEYTRYRRVGRTAHSALMERIEDTLNAQWAKEKLEAKLLQQRKSPSACV